MDKRSQVVLLHDVGRNVFCRDAHVFVAIHGRAEVKIFSVGSEHFCVRGGHGAVEEKFDGLLVGGGCADFAFVVNTVAANGEADAVAADVEANAVRFNLVYLDGGDNEYVAVQPAGRSL